MGCRDEIKKLQSKLSDMGVVTRLQWTLSDMGVVTMLCRYSLIIDLPENPWGAKYLIASIPNHHFLNWRENGYPKVVEMILHNEYMPVYVNEMDYDDVQYFSGRKRASGNKNVQHMKDEIDRVSSYCVKAQRCSIVKFLTKSSFASMSKRPITLPQRPIYTIAECLGINSDQTSQYREIAIDEMNEN
jgi:hypothetical protein